MKKGTTIVPEWLIHLALASLEILGVALILAGLWYVVYQSKTPDEVKDFNRVIDATVQLIDNFDDGKIVANAEFKVPIISSDAFQISYYTAAGPITPPPKCKGKPCICLLYTDNGLKEKCKPLTIKTNCKPKNCGEELCAAGETTFNVKKQDIVNLKVTCTSEGSRFTVQKA